MSNQSSRQKLKLILTSALGFLLLPSLRLHLLLPPLRLLRPTPRPCGPAGTAFRRRLHLNRRATCPEVGGVGSGEDAWWRRSPEACRSNGCDRGRRGGALREGQQSVEDERWRKRTRSDDGGGGSGGGDGDGGGGGVGAVEQRFDRQALQVGGARPAGAPSLVEAVGRKTWRMRSDGGRGGGGERNGGGGGVTGWTGTASHPLSAVTTGRGSCSHHPPLACRVSHRRRRGPPSSRPLLCQTHRRLLASCRKTGSRCEMGGGAGVSDWLSS